LSVLENLLPFKTRKLAITFNIYIIEWRNTAFDKTNYYFLKPHISRLITNKSTGSQNYSIVTGTFLSLVAVGVVLASFGAFFKPLSSELGWARGDTSGAFSLAMMVSGVIAIFSGRLADRVGPRWVIIGCGVLIGISMILLSGMTSLWQLYFYYGVLVGCGLSCIVPATSLIVRTYERRRGLLTGIIQAGGSVGAIMAAPFATMLIEHFSWRQAFIIIGILVLALNVVAAILLRKPASGRLEILEKTSFKQNRTSEKSGSLILIALGSLPFWLLGIILFTNGFAQNVINVHIIPHATDTGISPIIASSIMSVFQGASALGAFASGRTNDVIGGRTSMIIYSAILAFSMALLLFADSGWLFYLVAILSGIGIGGVLTLRSTLVAELYGLRSHGEISGAIMCISSIGCAVGPLAAGYAFDVYGKYLAAFIITLALCLIQLALAWYLKSRTAASV
jgi:MFS family permease